MCANVVSELCAAINSGFKAGINVEVLRDKLTGVRDALSRLPLQAALKRWLKFRAIDAGYVRAPLANLTEAQSEEVRGLSALYEFSASTY